MPFPFIGNRKCAILGPRSLAGFIAKPVVPPKESEEESSCEFHPEYTAWDRISAVAAAATQNDVTEHGDEVIGSQAVATGGTVRRRGQQRLPLRQSINDHIEEASQGYSQ